MKRKYCSPAIYRWNIFSLTPNDMQHIYIGECKKLVPDRLNGFLKPGPSQATNKRINNALSEEVSKRKTATMEILRFDEIRIGNNTFITSDLESKFIRLFIENLLIVHYQKLGYLLLNKIK
jgi:hypothetical protein